MRVCFRLPLFVGTCGLLAAAEPSAKPPDFIVRTFGDPPDAAKLTFAGTLAPRVSQILGHPYPQQEIPYWAATNVTAWILHSRAKSGRITAGFVIRDGKVSVCEVQAYTESRGREIRARRFLKQLLGASLREGDLDRNVDGITGATLSVNAIRNLTRLALTLDAAVRER